MKKWIGIVFLGMLLLQLAGTYVYFIFRLSGIRSEMREQLKHKPEEELNRFVLTLSEYKTSRVNDHEVKIDGKMYDIARIAIHRNQVWVYALHDEAEDNLLSFLQEMVDRSTKDKKPVPATLIHLLALQFVVIENSYSVDADHAVAHQTPYSFTFHCFSSAIEPPPPRG